VFRRTWCRVACALGAFFHLGVWMQFSIIVAENLITYASFVCWASALPRATSWLRNKGRQYSPGTRLALCAIPFVVGTFELIWFDSLAVEQLHQTVRLVVLFTAPVVAAVYLLSLLRPGPGAERRPAASGLEG
jgi:hypothetical protein